MDEYKPITGELRGAGRESDVYHVESDTVDRTVIFDGDRFDGLCDDIDSIHAQLERDYARVKAERDSMAAALDAAQGEHAYAPESHYMLLPKDMDGKPIHMFDLMDTEHGVETVEGILSDRFLVLRNGSWLTVEAATHRHHVPDTWERIVEDALSMPIHSQYDVERLVARCKALAGEL